MKSVLVDTSVWVNHFRHRDHALLALLHADRVLIHPLVVAEIACGTPPEPRAATLGDLELLKESEQVSLTEARDFIERERLHGKGCGLVDILLLASAMLTPATEFWTSDKKLKVLAERFGIAHLATLDF